MISIVIPTYNRAQIVPRAILSAYRQSLRDFEIIVVDDCSTDDTAQTVEAFATSQVGLRDVLQYVRLDQNRGANAARNVGIARARGAYLAFLDSDDLWHPSKLERQMNAIASRRRSSDAPYFLAYTGRYRVDDHYDVIARQLPGRVPVDEHVLRMRNAIGTLSSVVVSTEVARRIGGFDERLPACQDWDFYLRAAPACEIVAVREPLVMYFDGRAHRISLDARPRLRAHLAMYRKHMRGRLSRRELKDFYRSLAEDLDGVGFTRLGSRVYVRHKLAARRYVEALGELLGLRAQSVRAERYAGYVRQEARRTDKASDVPYLSAYRELLSAQLFV